MGLFDFLFKDNRSLVEKKYEYLMDKVYNEIIKDDDISQLDENEKVFYVLYTFDMEFQNGGLCQFFVNSSREYAPLIGEYLNKVGAIQHKKMFDEFVTNNNIDLSDLSFFMLNDISEYGIKASAYPFDEFDDSFGNLPELVDYLEKYLKNEM